MILSFLRSTPIMIFFTFLFVFGAPVKLIPLNTSKLALLVSMLAFSLMFYTSWLRSDFRLAPKPLYVTVFMSFLLMSYSALLSVTTQTYDFSLSYNLFILTFENIIGSYIFYSVFLKGKSSSQILDVFVWVGFIQSLIIVAMFVNLPVREFVFEWFANEQIIEMSERYGGIRGFGIAGSVTYDFSVLLSIIMIFTSYQICNSSSSQRFYIFAWILGFFSIMVSGRTGFIGVLISLWVIFVFLKRKQALTGVNRLIVIFVGVVLASIFFLQDTFILIVDVLLPYAFEMFFSAAQGDGFNTKSTGLLYKMYFSVSDKTFFMGDARWLGISGGYYRHTDAGYMRHMLFYGFLGSLVLYLLYAFVFVYLYRFCEKKWRVFILPIAGYAFLVHAKGDFLVGSSMNIKVFFLLFIFIMFEQEKLNIKRLVR